MADLGPHPGTSTQRRSWLHRTLPYLGQQGLPSVERSDLDRSTQQVCSPTTVLSSHPMLFARGAVVRNSYRLRLASFGSIAGCALAAAVGCGGTPDAVFDPPATVDAGVHPDIAMMTTDLPSPRVDSGTATVDTGGSPRLDAAIPELDAAGTEDLGPLTPDMTPDGGPAAMDSGSAVLGVGGRARVTASALNLRSGAGTSNPVLAVMPCGSTVDILGGPSSGWWNVQYGATAGWSSGAYLVPEALFDPTTCGGMAMMSTDAGMVSMGDGSVSMPGEVAGIFTLARSAVGYSYYWGHGSWGTDGLNHGACAGNCPSCTHSGAYGADCSGFVAKAWQIPGPSPVTTDAHPYSTYDFYNSTTHWSPVPRASIQPADAMTYNASGAGHILLFESGSDPWGNVWAYEARGCATGIVHDLRVVGTAYIAIRREGL